MIFKKASIEEATKANEQPVHSINERDCETNFAKKRDKDRNPEHKIKRLYIGKLPQEINEKELKEYFEKFGKVEDAFLSSVKFAQPLNGYPQHKGYGFVTFEGEEDANKAVDHKEHILKETRIFVRKAIPLKDEERPKNENSRKKNRNRENRNTEKTTTTTTTTVTTTTTTVRGSEERTPVVVVRRNPSSSSSSSSSSSFSSSSSSSSSQSSNQTPSNSNNNANNHSNRQNKSKKKVTIVNQTKTHKPVIEIKKTSKVNPWGNVSNSPQTQDHEEEFPGLGKSKKTQITTITKKTIIINDDRGKEDVEEN